MPRACQGPTPSGHQQLASAAWEWRAAAARAPPGACPASPIGDLQGAPGQDVHLGGSARPCSICRFKL